MRISRGILLLAIALGLAACDSSSSLPAPLTPSQLSVSQPTPVQAVFTDLRSGFSTSDVRDSQDQIVRFNSAAELLWTADGTIFPGYPVRGNLITVDRSRDFFLDVRFGSVNGERRAYLTWYDNYNHYYPGTVVDIEVVSGQLAISETKVPVPET